MTGSSAESGVAAYFTTSSQERCSEPQLRERIAHLWALAALLHSV